MQIRYKTNNITLKLKLSKTLFVFFPGGRRKCSGGGRKCSGSGSRDGTANPSDVATFAQNSS